MYRFPRGLSQGSGRAAALPRAAGRSAASAGLGHPALPRASQRLRVSTGLRWTQLVRRLPRALARCHCARGAAKPSWRRCEVRESATNLPFPALPPLLKLDPLHSLHLSFRSSPLTSALAGKCWRPPPSTRLCAAASEAIGTCASCGCRRMLSCATAQRLTWTAADGRACRQCAGAASQRHS